MMKLVSHVTSVAMLTCGDDGVGPRRIPDCHIPDLSWAALIGVDVSAAGWEHEVVKGNGSPLCR